jgi:hypothetical protein
METAPAVGSLTNLFQWFNEKVPLKREKMKEVIIYTVLYQLEL